MIPKDGKMTNSRKQSHLYKLLFKKKSFKQPSQINFSSQVSLNSFLGTEFARSGRRRGCALMIKKIVGNDYG